MPTPRPKFSAPPWIGSVFYQSWEGQGFSEVYYVNGANAGAALTNLGTIISNRKALFTKANFVKFYRVSDGTIRGDTTVQPLPSGTLGTYGGDAPPGTGDTNQALKLRVQCADSRFFMRYLHLIPLDNIVASGLVFTTEWNTAWTAYVNGLKSLTVGMFAPNRSGDPGGQAVQKTVTDVISFGLTTRRTGRPFGSPRGRSVIRF
jgi:hypothetical protein